MVNPTYLTAQSTLLMLAASGNTDAIKGIFAGSDCDHQISVD
jgi:hypothetical protein